ncbi:hypothetical protein [Spiroplasma endosymbiont of Eupeodes luniger]|uniref:hypothetical protein n=1 Tax=Spiroplasma endosymbiont of Eupeodes luniger TaxID=3066300 RepID=UPI0030D28769
MKDFQLWKVTNACQEVKQYAYINLLCAQINKRFKTDSATNQSIENLIRLTKLNDIVGFKVAYQKLTNYNFEAVAIKSLKEHYMHFIFDDEYGIYFQFKNYNFNSFIDFMQIRENNHRLPSEPKVGQRAVPDELDNCMGKNEQCTIVKRQAPPVSVKPAMKPLNSQAKNEQGAKSNLEIGALKETLNWEIEQVAAERNRCNLYQGQLDSNGNFNNQKNKKIYIVIPH